VAVLAAPSTGGLRCDRGPHSLGPRLHFDGTFSGRGVTALGAPMNLVQRNKCDRAEHGSGIEKAPHFRTSSPASAIGREYGALVAQPVQAM
jgi:hypothetical protein